MSTGAIAIGIGGNLGTYDEILARFVRAREALAVLGAVRSAQLYRTAPIGPEQPPFLNTAVLLRVDDMQPAELIATTLELERASASCGDAQLVGHRIGDQHDRRPRK